MKKQETQGEAGQKEDQDGRIPATEPRPIFWCMIVKA